MALVMLALVATLTVPTTRPPAGDAEHLRLAAQSSAPPRPVTIGTVPPVAGFPVTLDGRTNFTDGLGKAHFDAVADPRHLDGRVALTSATLPIGGQQVQVSADRLYPSRIEPQLALDLSHLVQFRFIDADGAPIDTSSIETITVKSSTGAETELPVPEGGWLHGSRVVSTSMGLQVTNIDWRVRQVEYAGSNVVNTSQQHFLPAQQQAVDVTLLFFGVNLEVRDAMFGFSHGGEVNLVYPDGHSQRFPLEDDGRLSLTGLPRGDYTLTIVGAGPQMPRPMAISRDQDVRLTFYSWLDVLTVLSVFLGLAVGLAMWGQLRRRRDTEITATPDMDVPDPATADDGAAHDATAGDKAGRHRAQHAAEPPSDLTVVSDRRTG